MEAPRFSGLPGGSVALPAPWVDFARGVPLLQVMKNAKALGESLQRCGSAACDLVGLPGPNRSFWAQRKGELAGASQI